MELEYDDRETIRLYGVEIDDLRERSETLEHKLANFITPFLTSREACDKMIQRVPTGFVQDYIEGIAKQF